MKKLFFFISILVLNLIIVSGSDVIIYIDEGNNKKEIENVQEIYDIDNQIENVELDLSRLEKEQNLNKLEQIYKEEIQGEALVNDIKSIEVRLKSIKEFEQKVDSLDVENIKKKERERIRELRLAISTLESKNLVNKRELERLKQELNQRERKLNNIDNTLKKVTLLKNKLERRLDRFKEESFLIYEVQKGDFLWKISNKKEFYGKGRLWPLIYKYNIDKITDPDLIEIGWKLKIPIKKYRIKKGDESLYEVAHKIYNDGGKWRWIYWANQDKIKNPNEIKVGWILKIPLE